MRVKCDRNLAKLNASLRRNSQVCADILPARTARSPFVCPWTTTTEPVKLELLTASETQAGHLAERFRAHPEQIYNGILDVLLSEPSKE